MKAKGILLVFVLLILATVLSLDWTVNRERSPIQQQPIELTISAAVSLKDALGEIQKNFHERHSSVRLVFNFGASGSLQRQIEQGAPVDIFISAAPQPMNALEEQNLIIKPTRKNLVTNKLVIIVPAASQLPIVRYDDLLLNDIQRVAIGEPAVVPAGQYAQQVLHTLGIWQQIKVKAVFAKDVRTVLTYVETGNADAGIVYKTDAAPSQKVKVVASAPEGSHQPIVYPVAVVAGAIQSKAAIEFVDYLFNDESKRIFEKNGFSMSQ